jgi:hypothetical protein
LTTQAADEYVAQSAEKSPSNGVQLSATGFAAIWMYTAEGPLYKGMNGALGGWGKGGKAMVKYYLQYIKLLMHALLQLPLVETTVFRGARCSHAAVLALGMDSGMHASLPYIG